MIQTIEKEFKNFILKQNHPCVMAQTVFKMNTYHLGIYETMRTEDTLLKLKADLNKYLENYNHETPDFETFIACFKDDWFEDELAFETCLWELLQHLHALDPQPWDAAVSNDVSSPEFSFSLFGNAFYVVGMHPKSSRLARRSPYPTLVFNLHSQFEKLRDMGVYQKIKRRIRQRDKKLQGSINPMLQDFGAESEAKQYSGRHVGRSWKCPFHQ
ncbi:MAG TPA: guanitoxin biosynthesis heme-dependent pre-guanitoxin N-hydroxylase GntA [Aquaticitalea sp.]|nr:guanitoxin biosynthesis heme-dependent pre-guanitoxin N-hydroxylase GntA [Aquaticitalea sp.]